MKTENKKVSNFYCIDCNFHCQYNSVYNRHLLSQKHYNNTQQQDLDDKIDETDNSIKNKPVFTFLCEHCDKSYKARNGLWYHQQRCYKPECDVSVDNSSLTQNKDDLIVTLLQERNDLLQDKKEDKDLIVSLLKQTGDMHSQVIDLLKTGTHNTNTNTNINHNKTFNLQFFLNETCKDAMNITDFVQNLQLQIADFEKLGDRGYVNGITDIIVKNLKGMDVSARPIHCTDLKREILYVKDEDKWEKEEDNRPKVRSAIKHIAHKNSKLLYDYKAKHPDYANSSSRESDKYNKIMIESMGGKGDNDYEKENKIIKNISKEIIVEKSEPK